MSRMDYMFLHQRKKSKWKERLKAFISVTVVIIGLIYFGVHMGRLEGECKSRGGHLVEDYRGILVCTE